MTSKLRPPRGGTPPPETVSLPDGSTVELRPIAVEICARYRREFPDEAGRYGDAGAAWCVHDNQHILNWAILGLSFGGPILQAQVDWLGSVLVARSFPLDRLARDLQIASETLAEREPRAAEAAAALAACTVG